MTEHTPLPWNFDGHGINAKGERIAKMSQAPYNYDTGQPVRNEVFDANAEFIVRACNSYDEILKALEYASLQFRKMGERAIAARIDQALTKASPNV